MEREIAKYLRIGYTPMCTLYICTYVCRIHRTEVCISILPLDLKCDVIDKAGRVSGLGTRRGRRVARASGLKSRWFLIGTLDPDFFNSSIHVRRLHSATHQRSVDEPAWEALHKGSEAMPFRSPAYAEMGRAHCEGSDEGPHH